MSVRAVACGLALFVLGCNGGRDKWIADLQAKRPEDRATAVKKLAEHFNADDVGLFTQAARDPVPFVRAEAMTALGKSQDPRVVDLLAEALGDPEERVQSAAAYALASVKSDKARTYLTLQYGKRGRNARVVIVQALKNANVPGAMAQVIAAEASATWERTLKTLTQGTVPERVGAAEELGRSGRPEAVDRLVPLLKQPQVVLAAAAAKGLGHAGDLRAVPALVALLQENYAELREAACEALGRLRAREALGPLRDVALDRSPASLLATRAIIAMERHADPDKALCEIALAGPGPEATAAGRELRRRGGCPAEPIAEKLRNPPTQAAALAAVVALGPPLKELAPKISPLLTSADVTTRKLAVDALVEVGELAGPVLLKAYEAELKLLEPVRGDWISQALPEKYGPGFDPNAPSGANDDAALTKARQQGLFQKVNALAAQKAKEAGKVVLEEQPPRELVDDGTDEQLKALAALVRALGKGKVDGARERLEPWTRDAAPGLRGAAFGALGALGAIDAATPGLFDTDRSVQAATAWGLVDAGEGGVVAVLDALVKLNVDRTRMLEALKDRPLPERAAPLLEQLMKEGGGEAGTAALLAAQLKGPQTADLIVKLLDDRTTVARRDLVVALGQLRDKRAAEAVAKEAFSDAIDVRAAAAEALALVGGPAQLEQLDALKGDYALRVRQAAASALAVLAPETKR